MAHTTIGVNKVVFEPYDSWLEAGPGPIVGEPYFNLADLVKVMEQAGAEGFIVRNATIVNGNKRCKVLIAIRGRNEDGYTSILSQENNLIAMSCPRIVDTVGGNPIPNP